MIRRATSWVTETITIVPMSPRTPRRALPVLAGVLLLGACGSSATSSETTLSPSATPWRTVPPVSATAIPTVAPVANISYTAREGDYSNLIAQRAGGGCSGAEIMSANPEITTIEAGVILQIPANCLGPGITEAILNETVVPDTKPSEKTTTTRKESYNSYTIQRGDSWVRIARKVGCTYRQMRNANPDVERLYAGRKLRVPKSCDDRD